MLPIFFDFFLEDLFAVECFLTRLSGKTLVASELNARHSRVSSCHHFVLKLVNVHILCNTLLELIRRFLSIIITDSPTRLGYIFFERLFCCFYITEILFTCRTTFPYKITPLKTLPMKYMAT